MVKKKTNSDIDVFFFEKKASAEGYSRVAGIDEAGRGPLAGPVVASAVTVKSGAFTQRIDDSKKLSAARREKAFLEIFDLCDVGIGFASVEEIDRLNIYNATLLAMKRAVLDMPAEPDYLLIDGRMDIPLPQPRKYLVGGESQSVSIACASVIAKVYRDKIMMEEHERHPEYNFGKHKGYGTREHLDAIRQHGLSTIHRRSFGPFGDLRNK